ncbi:MAG: class I SAM-dependent methyltransferase [Planctomycetota bacterium]
MDPASSDTSTDSPRPDTPGTGTGTGAQNGREPWQLRMFGVSLKKQQKLKCLLGLFPKNLTGDCLLVTCGDNNGATNYRMREVGGTWRFCDLEEDNVEAMSKLLGEHVPFAQPDALPYEDASFDLVVTIDCHEHLDEPIVLNRELARVVRPGGLVVVTVPNGDTKKLAVRLKHAIGMDKARYGHKVVGYDVPELEEMMQAVALEPVGESSYSRIFTESLELAINFAYMRVLARGKTRDGQIAPTSEDQLRKVEKSYRMYRVLYPFFWLWSQLDKLVFWGRGYAVAVAARRPGS